MMTITTGTRHLQQRMEALERANEIRARRAQLKRDLKDGRKAIEEILRHPPDYLSSATIFDLLIWTPRRKHARATKLLTRCQISPSLTVGALTARQRRVLIAELQQPGS